MSRDTVVSRAVAEAARSIGGVWDAAKPAWISVKDRLPDQAGYKCLVFGRGPYGREAVFTAFTGYGEPGWWTSEVEYMALKTGARDNKVWDEWKITHWMPFPEPPKEETE